MTEQSSATSFLTPRLQSWLTALIILATVALAFVVTNFVAGVIYFFGDVIMIFFLAWLLAFVLSPLANGLLHLFPRLPRALAVILVYTLLIVALIAAMLAVALQLYNSINTLVNDWPTPERLQTILAPLQTRLNDLGLGQIHLAEQANVALENVKNGASGLIGPLGGIAYASLGILGNVLFVFFLSLYMAVDRDHIMSFLFRLVPPTYEEEAKLLAKSVSRSFGGFIRGSLLSGAIYGSVSMFTSLVLGLPYMPVTAASAGILQMIPFFGPFFSWMPPVLVAIFFKPDAVPLALVFMVAGWFVLMNIVNPKVMAESVGLHPVVVLGTVMIGSKMAGVPGAIFGVPIAAVCASFFFFYFRRRRADAVPVAVRAARRVEEREGHPVRVPRLPRAGEDQEVEASPSSEPAAAE